MYPKAALPDVVVTLWSAEYPTPVFVPPDVTAVKAR